MQETGKAGKPENILSAILRDASDSNISFSDLRFALESLDFEVRIKGDHFIYSRHDVAEIINIQPMGNKAKAYQVKQVRNLIFEI